MTFITGNIVVENSLSANSISVSGTVINKDGLLIKDMMMSTGLYAFSGITLGTGNTFNVGGARAFIIDTTDPLNVVPQFINYSGTSGLTTPFLTASSATYILLNSANTLTYTSTEPTLTQRRQNVFLGVIGHPNSTTTGVGNRPDIGISTMSQIRDMFQPIRYINDGVTIYANSNNLTLANTAGSLYSLGIGFVANGQLRPSSIDISAGTPTTFQYRTQTGGTFANTTTISAGTYDLNGTPTVIPGGGNTSTNQRIYLLENGVLRAQFGQNFYASLSLAIEAIQTETFVVANNHRNLGILIGIVSLTKSCTDLSDTATAKFFTVSKFGESLGAAAGVSTATLQSAYNNSGMPEITTNASLTAVMIQRGSAADTDLVFGVNNGSGIPKFTVNGNGTLSAMTYVGGTGATNNSSNGFVHGRGSSAGTANDITILGPNLIGTSSGFTYVNALNIKQIGAGPSSVDLGLDANGNVVNQISDIRMKENISTIENALDKVRNLRGVKYQWKDRNAGGDDFRLGFIAQEVQEVEPMLISPVGGMLGVQYKDIPALLVEAIKELASGTITTGNTYLETQTILAEDNNIQLNYNGTEESAIGGGIEVLHAKGNGISASLNIDSDGNWVTDNDFKPNGLVIPYYTPSSSNDINGNEGILTRDDDYLYVKTLQGWKRTNLESF